MGFQSTSKLWKKDETAALIALYETERCLYDPNDRDFVYPEKQAEAYERICKIMLRIRPNVTIDEITYKITVLRKQYEGELLHRNISIETGLCTKDSYKPGMWCFGLLQFLDEFLSVKTEDGPNKNKEDSDNEMCDVGDTDRQKNSEECSDVDANDESDDQEEVKERIFSKKRKVGSSSSSSERDSRSSSIRKFLSSASENKLKNSSFSVKKFQSSSSHERKLKNSSSSVKKVNSHASSGKKVQKPSSVLKKSQNPSPSFRKTQNASSSHKKNVDSSPFLRKLLNSSSSDKKVPSSSSYEKRRKSSSSSERELDTSSMDREMKEQFSEDHFENHSSEKDTRNSFPAAKEANVNSFERELFDASFSAKEFDVTTEKASEKKPVDREDIFGRYVACELRALRCHPVIYLQTKQSILESLNSANFELLNPE